MSPQWLAKMSVQVAASTLAGLVGAFLVWNFFYSIGDRVITDETYARLESRVSWSGCAVGLIVGLLTAAVRRHRPFLALVGGHMFAVMSGFIGGSFSWDTGIFAYFGSLIAFQLLMFWKAMFDYEQ